MINFRKQQAGASLMEVLVAMSISLVVTASMVALMANSLGSTARIVKMSKLSDDMRVAMQMVTRDLRRSNYNANTIYCYGNDQCALDDDDLAFGSKEVIPNVLTLAGAIGFKDEDEDGVSDDECFTFLMDRKHEDEVKALDGDSTNDPAGGFRRRVTVGGVGVIEMWTGEADAELRCDGTADWVEITDPGDINITAFTIDNNLSYEDVVLQNINGNRVTQTVRKIRMSLQGQLVMDPTVWRRVEDVISVRNDLVSVSST